MNISLIAASILFVFLSAGIADTSANSTQNIRKMKPKQLDIWLKNQFQNDQTNSSSASLIKNNYPFFSFPQKQTVINILANYDTAEVDKLFVDIAMADSFSKTGRNATKILKKRFNQNCRKYLIGKLLNGNPEVRKKAVQLAKRLKNHDLHNDLVNELEKELKVQVKSYTTTLDLDYTQRKHTGWTDYSNQARVGDMKVNNNIKMPTFGTVSVKSRITLNTAKVLKLVTGKNFGNDPNKWRWWLIKEKNKRK